MTSPTFSSNCSRRKGEFVRSCSHRRRGSNCPPSYFNLSENTKFGAENPPFGDFRGKIEILSTHNLPCLKFPAVCWEFATCRKLLYPWRCCLLLFTFFLIMFYLALIIIVLMLTWFVWHPRHQQMTEGCLAVERWPTSCDCNFCRRCYHCGSLAT